MDIVVDIIVIALAIGVWTLASHYSEKQKARTWYREIKNMRGW